MNKKAATALLENIVFVIVTFLFFAILFTFVFQVSNGSFILENYYAKQAALLIDRAEPGTLISLDFSDAAEIIKENEVELEDSIVIGDNKIKTHFSNVRTYEFQYFNDVRVERSFSISEDKTILNLVVMENDAEK